VSARRELIQRVVGAIHGYLAERYQELRFGSASESAFEWSAPRLTPTSRTSFVGHWQCFPWPLRMRRLITRSIGRRRARRVDGCSRRSVTLCAPLAQISKATARQSRWARGTTVNRLATWIAEQAESRTAAQLAPAELAFLGRRLDAADAAGQNGATHSNVTRQDASRFITATYLILGERAAATPEVCACERPDWRTSWPHPPPRQAILPPAPDQTAANPVWERPSGEGRSWGTTGRRDMCCLWEVAGLRLRADG
jgi:hypothetical protein